MFILFLQFSCGGTKEEKSLQESPSASDLMAEAPAYDASKIDPKAEVVTINLKAIGNTMADISYDNTMIRVKAGTTVKLILENTSTDETMLHNFTLIEEGTIDKVAMEGVKAGPDKDYIPALREVLVATKMLKPKESVEILFPAPVAGTYDFICTYPGHSMKMRGKFVVEGGA
jgi:azurin